MAESYEERIIRITEQYEEESKKRDLEEIERTQDLEKIKSKITSEEEVKKLEYEAKQIEKLYAIDMWTKLFARRSFLNEIPAQIAYHVHLGQRLKWKKIYLNNKKYLDWREHACWIQPSGSGKGQLMDLFTDISDGTTIMLNPNGEKKEELFKSEEK